MVEWIENIKWNELMVAVGVNLLQILAIIIVFLIAKKIGNNVLHRSFERLSKKDDISIQRVKTLEKLSFNIITYVFGFIAIVMIFEVFGLDTKTLIAGAGVLGLAIGFGAQGLVSDVVTGFFLLIEKQIEVDNYVTMAGYSGIVEEVGLKTTTVRGFDGTLNYIPNREISSLSNHSRGNMRALVDIGISYNDDIDKAMTVLQDACDAVAAESPEIVEGPNVLGVQSFGSSDVVLRVVAKTENMQQWAIERKLRKAIKEAFDKNNIEIPYPHQVYISKTEEA
ncbi:mechanosensitive ion channel protein [Lottiidibacillus patelloidae]|uniref:Mechanosensitive ion channel protein n=1 Tax=Lottiidibacillus patelloidae TaxID=2670334 RepID=A0A263BXW3_9BACI|nr:mechanosensitive ion channel family protein [Lottiidibacillus patelloidae]OZM58412.1 mechanosensitive ion channel protein [Lottiidibacillus patelloidae]